MANQWNDTWVRNEMAAAHEFERALRGERAFSLPGRPRAFRRRLPEATANDGEALVGAEDRVQVRSVATHPSTRVFPFNTICMIRTATTIASGTLLAPQVVLTAAHVLRPHASVTITPGADMSAATDEERRPATPRAQSVPSARFSLHPTLDLGLAFAPAAFTRPREFMMLQPRGDANTATLLTNAGYPDGSTPPPGWSLGTMWRHTRPIAVADVTATQLFYDIDTSPGHSGSPLWLLGNDGIRLLLAVHTTGVASCRPNRNCGVRISRPVITWIIDECRTAGVAGPRVDQVAMTATRP
jgi:V8-like Glu-specific endopeptidase